MIEDRKQPPSIGAAIYLDSEMRQNNNELYYSNQYIDQWFQNTANVDPSSNDRNLELLLGIQGWRSNIFDITRLSSLQNNIGSMTKDEQNAYQQLVAYPLYHPNIYFNNRGGVVPMMAAGAMAPAAAAMPMAMAPAPAPMPAPTPTPAPTSSQDTLPPSYQALNDFMVNITANTRQWVHTLRPGWTPTQRIDLTETVLFSSANRIRTGSLKGSLRLSDLITQFRITVNAVGTDGSIGYKKYTFQTAKNFYVNFDMPQTMTVGDQMNVDLHIGNLYSKPLVVTIAANLSDGAPVKIALTGSAPTVRTRTMSTQTITLTALNITNGTTMVTIGVIGTTNGVSFSDSYSLPLRILPKGFPRQISYGGSIGSQVFDQTTPTSANFSVLIPSTIEQGSAIFGAKIFSTNYASLMSAVQALIQNPSGCFEQTSSTTYPMVMALQFLKAQPVQST